MLVGQALPFTSDSKKAHVPDAAERPWNTLQVRSCFTSEQSLDCLACANPLDSGGVTRKLGPPLCRRSLQGYLAHKTPPPRRTLQ